MEGLQIKGGDADGQLSTWSRRALAGIAAGGGAALLSAAPNWGAPATLRGWTLPADAEAPDIDVDPAAACAAGVTLLDVLARRRDQSRQALLD
ncbi:MAG: hypothetical protein KY449_08585 [Proteobacteria bacterium]|nr:hypothetical protein [Pseudomonadota bacterium]